MASTTGFVLTIAFSVVYLRFRSLNHKSKKDNRVSMSKTGMNMNGAGAGSGKGVVVKIGTRNSDLAMIQTRYAAKLIRDKFPEVQVEIIEPIKTIGDKVLTESLKNLAAKVPGLFTKDLEDGLVSGLYDIAVHSLKDVPTTLPDGLEIAAITEREDPHDALVVRKEYKGKGGLKSLPVGAVVGTSSVRREALLLRDYQHLNIKVIRGNVNTRLRKLDEGM